MILVTSGSQGIEEFGGIGKMEFLGGSAAPFCCLIPTHIQAAALGSVGFKNVYMRMGAENGRGFEKEWEGR